MPYQGEYIIIGPPGCGKTTRVAKSVEKIVRETTTPFGSTDRDPVLVCSLTRAAAAEAAGRIKLRREMVGTLHSHAFRALEQPDMVDNEAIGDWNEQYPMYALSGLDGEDDAAVGDAPGDAMHARYHLCRARLQEPRQAEGSLPRFAERYEAWKCENDLTDFSDLIDDAYAECDHAPFDPRVVIADEAQDMSAAEFRLIRKWGEAAGASILVGDPWQALYDWRGADPDYLVERDVGSKRDTLSQSHRVPKAVHRTATAWIRGLSTYQPIEYEPTDEQGEAFAFKDGNMRQPGGVVQYAEELWSGGESVMILASCGYMLQSTIRALKQRALPFSNPWRRKRGDWNPLTPASGMSVGRRFVEFCEFLYEWHTRQAWTAERAWSWLKPMAVRGLLETGAKKKIEGMASEQDGEGVEQPSSALRAMLDEQAEIQIDELARQWTDDPRAAMKPMQEFWLEHVQGSRSSTLDYALGVAMAHGPKWLLAEDERPNLPRIYVGTIHSFKGAEADHVLMYPDLSANGWRQYEADADPVIRQFYVGMTRARKSLAVVSGSGSQAVDLEPYL